MKRVVAVVLAILSASLGCASGSMIDPMRGRDAGPSGIDAAGADVGPVADTGPSSTDLGPPATPDAGRVCVPGCSAPQICRDGACITPTVDRDMDNVQASLDCDDTMASIGRSASRACTSPCGAGTEQCTDGVWAPCSAPTTCDCTAGTPPRMTACGFCGMQRQTCTNGAWVNEGGCTGAGVCQAGATEMTGTCGNCGMSVRSCNATCQWNAPVCQGGGECPAGMTQNETRACACGAAESRSRTCSGSCTWGGWSSFSGCTACPTCGDGTCGAGESCSTCADCRAGHQGTGRGGDSCAGVPAEQWRCVTQSGLGLVSQVCRNGAWLNFNLAPRNCAACVCAYSVSCNQ